MIVTHVIWLPDIEDKIIQKHDVLAEEVLFGNPRVRFVEKGHRRGEDVYGLWSDRSRGIHDRILHPQAR